MAMVKSLLTALLSASIILHSGLTATTAWAGFLTSSDQPLSPPTETLPLPPPSPMTEDAPDSGPPAGRAGTISDPQAQDNSPFEENGGDLEGTLEAETPVFESPDELTEEEEEEPTYDVPIVLNESVEDYITFFNTQLRDIFALWLARSGRYLPLMRDIFKKYGLPGDLVYVALIESGFNPYAYSRAKAVGPWQFIKSTGKLYGLRIDNWVDERRDPIKSTDAAARHLKDLYARFGSWPLALASYNAGERRIQTALVRTKTDDYWDLRNSRHIRRETKGYVPKFMAATIIAKNPERYGFSLEYHEPFTFDEVTVPGSADLRVMAMAAGIGYEDLKQLNPELRTEITPPTVSQYSLRLPAGIRESFQPNYAQIPDEKKVIGTYYAVRRNDTLSLVAKRFGTSVSLLREINHMDSNRILQVGETVFIPKLAVQAPVRAKTPAFRKSRIQVASAQNLPSSDNVNQRQIIYRVQTGDTLWDIARSFNISLGDLKRYNGLGRGSLIHPGDLLIVGFESKDR